MTYFYRETDAVSARWTANTSGSPLTPAQADENTYTSAAAIAALQAAVIAARGISSISISGNDLIFHMSDSTLEDVTIPISVFLDRVTWAALTAYAVNDTFSINGTLYRVLFAHTSAATFSAGANDGLGHDYYSAMLSLPGNALPTGGSVRSNLKKSSSSDYAVTWGFDSAADTTFSASTGSALTATNVASALEELETLVGAKSLATLSDVSFNTAGPVTGELLSYNGTKWTNVPQSSLSVAFSQITGSASASQLRDATVTALGTTGTVSLDPTLGDVFTITPSGGVTLNAASAPAGAKITVIVTTSGTSSFNITPTTNFKSQGALATGTVTDKTFSISFVGDGTNLVETSRTAAM